jgi:hypothetical protein
MSSSTGRRATKLKPVPSESIIPRGLESVCACIIDTILPQSAWRENPRAAPAQVWADSVACQEPDVSGGLK